VLSVWPYVPLGARVGQVGTITQSLLQGSVLPCARGACTTCYTGEEERPALSGPSLWSGAGV